MAAGPTKFSISYRGILAPYHRSSRYNEEDDDAGYASDGTDIGNFYQNLPRSPGIRKIQSEIRRAKYTSYKPSQMVKKMQPNRTNPIFQLDISEPQRSTRQTSAKALGLIQLQLPYNMPIAVEFGWNIFRTPYELGLVENVQSEQSELEPQYNSSIQASTDPPFANPFQDIYKNTTDLAREMGEAATSGAFLPENTRCVFYWKAPRSACTDLKAHIAYMMKQESMSPTPFQILLLATNQIAHFRVIYSISSPPHNTGVIVCDNVEIVASKANAEFIEQHFSAWQQQRKRKSGATGSLWNSQ